MEVIRLALEGKTTTEICAILRHSPEAVANYLGTFTRCAQLHRKGMEASQIAFLLGRGRGLVKRYLELLEQCPSDKLWNYHLEELLEIGRAAGEKNFGGIAMGTRADFVRKKYGPLARKTLPNALAGCLARDFPQLVGERLVRLAAERILEVVFEHIRSREAVKQGQVLWMGIAVEDRPGWRKPLSQLQLVPLLLELVTGEDIDAILQREKSNERLLRRCLRLCWQAHKQGGLLSNCDLAVLLGSHDTQVARVLW